MKKWKMPGTVRASWKGGRGEKVNLRINPKLKAQMIAWLKPRELTFADWLELKIREALGAQK
jgi:hypothetical protein